MWPYHDHSPSMMDVDRRRHVRDALDPRPPRARAGPRVPGRVLARSGSSWRSTGARSSATRRSSTRASATLVQWDVMAMGSDFHTFHVHGHRWLDAGRRAARHADGRAGRELPLPLARGGPRHVALPLPRRGPHDARHDRDLPRRAPMRRRRPRRGRGCDAARGRRDAPSRTRPPRRRRQRPVRGLRAVAARRAAGRDGAVVERQPAHPHGHLRRRVCSTRASCGPGSASVAPALRRSPAPTPTTARSTRAWSARSTCAA